MKNEYEYEALKLNPLMAQNLILELFSGKSDVPRKVIIKTVDETHFKRGGERSNDPIGTIRAGLDNLVSEGKASKPKTGYYSIHHQNLPEQPEPINKDEVSRLRSAIENEVEFIEKQINQLERRRSKLSNTLNEL